MRDVIIGPRFLAAPAAKVPFAEGQEASTKRGKNSDMFNRHLWNDTCVYSLMSVAILLVFMLPRL